ncbi:uncharacterized protein QC763_0114100 [Podospora pseudopauciseta]|uniref:Zn(2)-C6 fungal-type domain-containing protein n=1 Tax=Podospora pseudopauciseta TaxID=2093780 RepID=A0ABR0GZI3_9PEZI|nr:hypothetical protein QC763_0114100 [Podospora pseudopauciseta]
MPCSTCFTSGTPCIMAPESSRCAECVRRKILCDGSDVGSALTRTMEEQDRLEREEQRLEDQLSQLTAQLIRVKRTRRSLRAREERLFARGIQEEDAQVAQSAAAAPPASSPGAPARPDAAQDTVPWSPHVPDPSLGLNWPSDLSFDPSVVGPSFLATLDTASGAPSTSQGA